MANICTVSIMARGFKSEKDALECQKIFEGDEHGEAWISLFDSMTSAYPEPNLGWIVKADGWTKWTSSNLLDNKDNRDFKKHYPNYLTIQDVCKKYGVYVEILGQESGNNLGEHFGISPDGRMVLEEYFEFTDYYTAGFSSYKSFCQCYGEVLTEEEFNSDDWVGVGEPETPFGAWIENIRI